jgi:hypothetical protein
MMTAPKPVRSPSYPSTALRDAIDQVRKIESLYRTGQVDREAAAKLIGYSSLSGPANKALAALAQFGLVERAGKGEMRVTPRAKAILYSDNQAERHDELRAAALEPQLFRDLQERWPNMIPPEDGVIMFLNRQGFNQSAVRPAARAYLDTLLFLKEEGANDSHGGEQEDASESGSSDLETDEIMTHTAQPARASSSAPPLVRPNTTAASADRRLNQIDMNIQGDKVHLSALLNLKGLEGLEKKISALKILLAMNEGSSTDDGEEEGQDGSAT